MVRKNLVVKNRAGIHARPAALICETANKFSCDILMFKDDIEVNAKSVLSVITMGAAYNAKIELVTEGADEVQAANAIAKLFENRFEED